MMSVHQSLKTRPSYLEIDLSAIEHNLTELKKVMSKDTKVMAIVKGNAYGHGAVRVAQLLEKLKVDYLGVAIPEEGVELRNEGITTPILVLSAISDQQIPLCIENNLTITIPSDKKMEQVSSYAQGMNTKAKVHLKVDTGMGRIGVNHQRVHKFFPYLEDPHLHIEGLFTHMACSDEDTDLNTIQINRFTEVQEAFKKQGKEFEIVHMANSGGAVFHPSSHFDMVRFGMILYGLFEGRELPQKLHLKPAMSFKSEVVYFKFVPKAEGIGYGHHYTTLEDTRIVTIPVGYADGYQRSLSNKGMVLIGGHRYPISGRVCMDQMMVNIGRYTEAYVGDEVVLVGSQGGEHISFHDLSKWCGTSIYELMCQISYRVPRRYK